MSAYKVKKISRMGDFDPKYGQRYWGEVHDIQLPVAFNLMQDNLEIPPGATLEFEERTIRETGPQSKNPGSEYIFLKKVRVSGQQAQLAPDHQPGPSPASDSKMLQLIFDNTQQILKLVDKSGYDKFQTAKSQLRPPDASFVPDNVIEDIGDEPINLDDIPF